MAAHYKNRANRAKRSFWMETLNYRVAITVMGGWEVDIAIMVIDHKCRLTTA
jgi:hypothetical protein